MRSIGGLMDYGKLAQPAAASAESIPVQTHRPPAMATEYDLLLDQARIACRPKDRDGLRQAAHDLRASGLLPVDIAQALGIGIEAARALLEVQP